MFKLFVPVALVAMLITLAAWWDKPSPRADLTIINNGEVSTLDFTQMSWMQDFRAARLLWEGLTRSDIFSQSYKTLPAAADRWEISEDQLTYTFHLRPAAKWSNGEPVTSLHFRFAWFRMLLPENGADYAKLFRLIEGGDAFYKGRLETLKALRNRSPDTPPHAAETAWKHTLAEFDRLVRIDTPDPRTLRVKLAKPVPYFLSLTSFPAFFPLYQPLVEAHQSIDPATGSLKTESSWCKPPFLISNGPFTLTRWQFKRDMRYEKNLHYWDREHIALDSVSMPTVDDGNAAVLAFRTGNVDWVSDVVPSYRGDMLAAKMAFYREHQSDYDALIAQHLDPVEIDRRLPPDERKNIHAFPAFGTYFYNFNCRETLADGRPNPFRDARVRRAFAMTIDKAGLVENIRRSGEPAALALIPPKSIGGYQSPAGLPYNLEAAKQLLREAGYASPAAFPTVDLLFNKDGGHDIIAQFIAKGWEQSLGISVQLAQKEVKVFRELVKGGNFMVSRGTWFGDYGDPTTFLDINREGDGNNDRGYASPAYESLMTQAENERDPGKRLAALSAAERVLVEQDLPLVPIFHYVQIYLFDANTITGITPHPRQEQYLFLFDKFGDGKGTDSPQTMHR